MPTAPAHRHGRSVPSLAASFLLFFAGQACQPSTAGSTEKDHTGGLDTGGAVDCSVPPAAPDTQIWPVADELFYLQVGLGGVSMGESAIVVGPDGTLALVDAGNDSHDDDIGAVMSELVAHMNSDGAYPAAPFSADTIDHAVITHLHADHSDGLQDLLQDFTLRGRIVHRGLLDITPAAGEGAVEQLCEVLTEHPAAGRALCQGPATAPCDADDWHGSYPADHCDGLNDGDLTQANDEGRAYLPLGEGARLEFVGADGTTTVDRYETAIAPLLQDDSNGENARSLVALLRHGPFQLLLAGDLTGGGSDTDPVEQYYVARLDRISDIDSLGVDVLHAGHHGRDTSSSLPWADALLPADGRDRNVIMGISTAHVQSPHQQVLDTLLGANRLTDGRGWTTTVAPGGSTHDRLVDADGGHIIVATRHQGASYVIQAVDDNGHLLESRAFWAVGACVDR